MSKDQDLLDEIEAERTAKTAEFPRLIAEAEARLKKQSVLARTILGGSDLVKIQAIRNRLQPSWENALGKQDMDDLRWCLSKLEEIAAKGLA